MSTPVPFVDLSIVVPAYNEEHRISPTLARLSAFLANQPMRWEIVVVDDGSRDATCAVVQAAMAQIPNLRLVRQSPNRGKGAAVRLGMREARGQIRVMSDADGSMPPEQLPRLLAPILACQADIAIGSRYADGVRDTQCGFKAFTAEAARALFGVGRIDGWAFDLEILALARRTGFAIAEVGVEWIDDRRSRVNPLQDMWKVVREALTIRRNLKRGVYRALPIAA